MENADSAKECKAFVDDATKAASSSCEAAEEAANIAIKISKAMRDAEQAAQRANLTFRLQVGILSCTRSCLNRLFHLNLPCTLNHTIFGNDPMICRSGSWHRLLPTPLDESLIPQGMPLLWLLLLWSIMNYSGFVFLRLMTTFDNEQRVNLSFSVYRRLSTKRSGLLHLNFRSIYVFVLHHCTMQGRVFFTWSGRSR